MCCRELIRGLILLHTPVYVASILFLRESNGIASRSIQRCGVTMRHRPFSARTSSFSPVIKYNLCEIVEYITIVRNEIYARPGTRYTC